MAGDLLRLTACLCVACLRATRRQARRQAGLHEQGEQSAKLVSANLEEFGRERRQHSRQGIPALSAEQGGVEAEAGGMDKRG